MMKKAHISINPTIYQKAKQLAANSQRTFSNFVVRLICKEIENQEMNKLKEQS